MFVRLFICFYSIFLFREKIFRYICINLKFCIMRNLILFVGLFLSVSCVNRHSIHQDYLREAEAYMERHPDSALLFYSNFLSMIAETGSRKHTTTFC